MKLDSRSVNVKKDELFSFKQKYTRINAGNDYNMFRNRWKWCYIPIKKFPAHFTDTQF